MLLLLLLGLTTLPLKTTPAENLHPRPHLSRKAIRAEPYGTSDLGLQKRGLLLLETGNNNTVVFEVDLRSGHGRELKGTGKTSQSGRVP